MLLINSFNLISLILYILFKGSRSFLLTPFNIYRLSQRINAATIIRSTLLQGVRIFSLLQGIRMLSSLLQEVRMSSLFQGIKIMPFSLLQGVSSLLQGIRILLSLLQRVRMSSLFQKIRIILSSLLQGVSSLLQGMRLLLYLPFYLNIRTYLTYYQQTSLKLRHLLIYLQGKI